MLAAALLLTVTLVAAQEPRPCQAPEQWEGKFYRSDYSKNFTMFAKVSYDETNKRVREVEELEFGSERDYYDVLYLHNENKEYRLSLRTRKCNVTALTRPWLPFGVPRDAHYISEANVGPVNIPNEHVTVISYDGRDEERNPYYGTVSSPDCVPIASGFYSNRTGFIHTSFYDVTSGIPDPSVFIPPKECMG